MADSEHKRVDEEVRAACDGGDPEQATIIALRAYGSEIHGWLVDRLRSETHGADAFSLFTEDLWRGWKTFAWRCSVRGWSYVLARNAGNRVAQRAAMRRQRNTTYSSSIERIEAEIRKTTLKHLRTTVKDEFRKLREELSEEDQLVLVLRVDRRLPWSDVARVILDDAGADDERVTRESARLRKRLQIIKQRLRDMGREAGLL